MEHGLDPLIIDKPWEDKKIAYNIDNYNDLLKVFVTILQALTLEGWSTSMFNLMDSGTPWMASIYYYTIILLGSYFILNLILAVILSSFLKI